MNQYRETRIEGRRSFELCDDGVRVRADLALGPSIDTMVRYDQLEPTITVIRMHHSMFWWCTLGTPLFGIATIFTFQNFLFAISLCGLVVCFVVAVLTRKRVEYARFCSPTGFALLDIARSGPDSKHFDQYVKNIQERIVLSKSSRSSRIGNADERLPGS